MFHERERTAGVARIDHETNSHRAELTDIPLLGSKNARCVGEHDSFFQ
jgi:hypothetical protein